MPLPDALGIPAPLQVFEPSHAAALQRLDALQPTVYARTRNALDGAVSGLSPYLTHGVISLREAAQRVHARHPLTWRDKLVAEFGWRAFFHHVWTHAEAGGDAILHDLRPTAPRPGRYATTLPADIREGRTGVAAIDAAVRVLYATGYLHNHARMWLASYVVHLRKVHWRAGADWLYGHLLDGDLPSNHLSWQWVAGTFSSKPYLFNAANVRQFAPVAAAGAWDSSGSAIDRRYEELDAVARTQGDVGPEPGVHDAVAEPVLHGAVLASFMSDVPVGWSLFAMNNIANNLVQLIHPWSLSPPQTEAAASPAARPFRLGLIHLPAHQAWLWSERRWRFVLQAMAAVTDAIFIGDARTLDLSAAAGVHAQATRFPGYREMLPQLAQLATASDLFPDTPLPCRSFSQFYARSQRDTPQFADLLLIL